MENAGKASKSNPLSFYRYMKGDSDSGTEEEDEASPVNQNDEANPFSFKAFTSGDLPVASKEKTKSSLPAVPSDHSLDVNPFGDPMPSTTVDCPDCKRLTRENKRLHSKLAETLEATAILNKRVTKLTSRLKARDERESMEASQLEEMLHQVEKNLQQSTKRTEKAEHRAERLAREVEHLRTQLQLQNMGERTAEVGAELVEASQSAKHMLRQLMRGFDRLTVVGQSLCSDDKFSEGPTS